jgi:hypothetical protein
MGPLRNTTAMTPDKQRAVGIAGCRLVAGTTPYRLRDGSATMHVAVPMSLLLAEPSLHRWQEGQPVDCRAAALRGYRFVRSYEDAVAEGLL